MNKKNLFTLGRRVEPKYFPNQLLIIIVTLAFVAGIILHFFKVNTISDSLINGFFLAITTFFTWALAREVYPQGEYAALFASISVIITLLWFGIYSSIVVILMWFIISLRLINQTTGINATKIDMSIILVFSLVCAYIFSWFFLVFCAIIFFVNYSFTKDRTYIYFQIPVFLAIIVIVKYQDMYYNLSLLNIQNLLFIGSLSVIFIIMMWLNRNFYVICDYSKTKVPPTRILCGQILFIVFIFCYSIWFGDRSIISLIPIWCILIVSIIFSPMKILFHSYGQQLK
ncbi:MAG: hypothetical protein R6V50_08020 [Thermoplasmatota archaeon]